MRQRSVLSRGFQPAEAEQDGCGTLPRRSGAPTDAQLLAGVHPALCKGDCRTGSLTEQDPEDRLDCIVGCRAVGNKPGRDPGRGHVPSLAHGLQESGPRRAAKAQLIHGSLQGVGVGWAGLGWAGWVGAGARRVDHCGAVNRPKSG